ncbi:Zeatin o-glucosyltransferase [Forsythia ovata]|uniref:Zeatin o-glucosyltransferase n=1 Tax=Forsythia ovata TaxID=205694 RepID=A0ABD1S4B9_9LAMI
MGVLIASWPMHSDQPRNAVLITKVLKIGLEVRDWAHRNKVVSAIAVEKAVRILMDSGEGEEMRHKAAELAEAVKQSVMEALKLEALELWNWKLTDDGTGYREEREIQILFQISLGL